MLALEQYYYWSNFSANYIAVRDTVVIMEYNAWSNLTQEISILQFSWHLNDLYQITLKNFFHTINYGMQTGALSNPNGSARRDSELLFFFGAVIRILW